MTDRFNADEIFEIAEQIERNGAGFYRRAAESAEGPEIRPLLLQLANMEDSHERTFAGMRADLVRENPDWLPQFFDPSSGNEAALYLRAVAAGRVFDLQTDPASLVSKSEPLKSILTKAIGLEKDSVAFYAGLRTAVPEYLGREKLDHIIREEMGHITLLSAQFAENRKGEIP